MRLRDVIQELQATGETLLPLLLPESRRRGRLEKALARGREKSL